MHFLCLPIFDDIFADIADKIFSGPSPIFCRYRYFQHCIRVKASESDNQKHENSTRENKGAWNRQFAKLTEMKVQT